MVIFFKATICMILLLKMDFIKVFSKLHCLIFMQSVGTWRGKFMGTEKMGEYAAKRLLDLEPSNAGYYTFSTVQAVVERWDGVEELRRCMNDNDLMKKPGWSCVEAKGLIHGFASRDQSHPRMLEIY
ncbi:pentatricopeptide repeat-containing protein At2g03880, mitochondrial-like [Rhododendron vialii]|uniref:pentatricopeptide repeat-containing protein At2g03880, mitochondrial-like n=1 Tax=Rhododendron vialii TaxID=182163 RepID=UPI00265DEA21|nr:pentatricopeptide repeat-containing protein At2g03880, mitochondrial-like [Rhododendron vialii]